MKFIFPLVILIIECADILEAVEKSSVSFPYYDYLKSVTIILVLLFIFMVILKKVVPRKKYEGKSRDLITVLDRVQIEPTVALYMIKLKNKIWLLSVGNKNTQLISDISELITDDDFELKQNSFSFQEILDKIVKK
ncbi:MAG: hypothetical protein DKM50_03110 [Candidatus Margulisiibacteriota bacterium]|nr:MAG: hypothetical protein A2X43_09785 [Candidatus Margulisbacteria bacterium GWD2_39_127]OGI04586.1 MAG: hypothetical protein A2X42_07745 [Candidatus Margulisbacteria bacterium GWF2_38_17]OGI11882.1 MAG: hypothetical protein A2X41_11525 [Candidatus Margulisbacteria bacterium GWE2_39_32]PZM83106.1 MAG: hypothetical protein DKM50_03110 [Candidatus Margulisiibacteriota bacterium]HAR62226.1 hypothetical protein [Candidatus Margulisiibacteriota bacterium]